MANTNKTGGGATVAAQLATTSAPLDLHGMMLLGTFGTPANPGALLRLPSGKVVKVAQSDTVSGARVIAIRNGSVIVERSGRTRTIRAPGLRPQKSSRPAAAAR